MQYNSKYISFRSVVLINYWCGILGPVLYALSVSQLNDITEVDMFADDNYPIEIVVNIDNLKNYLGA